MLNYVWKNQHLKKRVINKFATWLRFIYFCMMKLPKINYDKLGIFTSVACAIHCTILPVFIGAIPFLRIHILDNPWIEYSTIVLSFLFGSLSLYHGFRYHHKRKSPIVLFSAGFTCLIINQLTQEQYVLLLIPSAAILIITAHLINISCCRKHPAKKLAHG